MTTAPCGGVASLPSESRRTAAAERVVELRGECVVYEAPANTSLPAEPSRLEMGQLTVRILHPDTRAPLWRAKVDFIPSDSPRPPHLARSPWYDLPDLRGAIEQVVVGFPPDMSQCSRRLGRRCASSDTP